MNTSEREALTAALIEALRHPERAVLLIFHCNPEGPVAWSPFREGFPSYAFVCPRCGQTGLRGDGRPNTDRLLYDIASDYDTSGLPRTTWETP